MVRPCLSENKKNMHYQKFPIDTCMRLDEFYDLLQQTRISVQDAVLIFTAGNNIPMKLSSEKGNIKV